MAGHQINNLFFLIGSTVYLIIIIRLRMSRMRWTFSFKSSFILKYNHPISHTYLCSIKSVSTKLWLERKIFFIFHRLVYLRIGRLYPLVNEYMLSWVLLYKYTYIMYHIISYTRTHDTFSCCVLLLLLFLLLLLLYSNFHMTHIILISF